MIVYKITFWGQTSLSTLRLFFASLQFPPWPSEHPIVCLVSVIEDLFVFYSQTQEFARTS
jgi:hypothetical protein